MERLGLLASCALAALIGCGSHAEPQKTLTIVRDDPTDVPLAGATTSERDRFLEGDARFDAVRRPADGLGPLYIRTACSACHDGAARGPGSVQKFALIGASDPLPYGNTVRPYSLAGATPITPPSDPRVKHSLRIGPPVFGRGYIEAIADAEIERRAAEQATRTDGVRGRVHRVRGAIGRFGFKARIATLTEFTADAFQGDMGITSPVRPNELPNPDSLLDDDKPGVDVTQEEIDVIADYMRLLAIPQRTSHPRGEALFVETRCGVCHVPSLRTRGDYPIAALADIDASVFSDLLLHDLGAALSDGLVEGEAGPSMWKTAPLIGVRFAKTLLHDGRAHTVFDAIVAHGDPDSEAHDSVQRFLALSPADRAALVEFVEGL